LKKTRLFQEQRYVYAVNGVSFYLNKGDTLGLVGESGCGKTTIGRVILRLIEPTAGVISFQGRDVADLKDKDLKKFRRSAQMIFQDPFASLNPRMTVGDIVGEPLLVHGIGTANDRADRVSEVLDKVGLEPAGYDPRTLKGMGLAYATSDRGACHLRTTFYKPELAGMIPPDQIEGKAEMFLDFEDRLTIFDTLVLCRFYRDFYLWDVLEDLINKVTGLAASEEILKQKARAVANQIRCFNFQQIP